MKHGLDGWSVYWSTELGKADGGGVTIEHACAIIFSAPYIAILSPKQQMDAVLHEVSHAIVGVSAEHTNIWVDKARELGGSGSVVISIDSEMYPWKGTCPDGHLIVTMDLDYRSNVRCSEGHEIGPDDQHWERNANSRAWDPAVALMAERYPEPPVVHQCGVGDVVYVIPFNSKLDNMELKIVELVERGYKTIHIPSGTEYTVRCEQVSSARSDVESITD